MHCSVADVHADRNGMANLPWMLLIATMCPDLRLIMSGSNAVKQVQGVYSWNIAHTLQNNSTTPATRRNVFDDCNWQNKYKIHQNRFNTTRFFVFFYFVNHGKTPVFCWFVLLIWVLLVRWHCLLGERKGTWPVKTITYFNYHQSIC